MSHPLLGNSVVVTNDGQVVSQKIARIGEILHDYNPELDLMWIHPHLRTTPEDHAKPWALQHSPAGREPYLVATFSDDEIDETIIARIFAMDNARAGRNTVQDKLNAIEQARALAAAKAREDAMAEAKDVLLTAFKSPLHTWKGPDGKVYS
jgi:hypothetical protein